MLRYSTFVLIIRRGASLAEANLDFGNFPHSGDSLEYDISWWPSHNVLCFGQGDTSIRAILRGTAGFSSFLLPDEGD